MAGFHTTRLISWIILGMAFSLFLYVGSNVAYTASSQSELASAWDKGHIHSGAPGQALTVAFARPRLADGQPLAKITVPSINFSGIVLEGSDNRILSGGPGHVDGTAYPGEPDNVVISNHNSYSLSWGDLKTGQDITLETDYGSYTYRVTGFKIVGSNDKSVTASTGRPSLTFITCYPLWAGALATQRYIVLADLVQS
jgi:LPXTG-site transpeptidase (sortase) family protein